jgi:Domain of unknown function (DUF305)
MLMSGRVRAKPWPQRLSSHIKLASMFGAFTAILMLGVFALRAEFLAHSPGPTRVGHGHTRAASFSASPSVFHSEMAQVNASMHEAMDIVPSGDVERDFVQMMIPHHQGAIDMAVILLRHGTDERLKRLAQSIIVEQSQEVAYMRTLGDARSKAASTNPTTHQ